ncbi:hypothetical protein GZH47_23975 [Paenibacillus rhizovicinus]|uniref:Uncharacterized protein n=1 Tax=Paenibacillus rhizovicinus TaxID=2704463 RepID=A0A6C0P4T0_9BACL|nr:hypothetical protein [Paenibacillus rhizovicinus]QHW33550.1 hypothetical protein GZH47_23975 [Paenibacillus rhizovicinus]
MSAYAEFLREKRAVEMLLADGYTIVGVADQLDGMTVQFKRPPSLEVPGAAEELRIRNADARKHVGSLLVAGQRKAAGG